MLRIRIACAALLATALLGCASQRPIVEIRKSGDHYYDLGQYDAAAAEYQEIVDRYPGDWEGQYQLGLCELQRGRAGAARRALAVALDRRPQSADIADALAEALFRDGDGPALFAFLQDRARSTQSPRAWLRLSRYAAESGDPDLARTAVDTAIELDAGASAAPYLVAADLAESVGDVPTAVRRLRQAYAIEPKRAEISDRLRRHGEIPGPTIALPPGR